MTEQKPFNALEHGLFERFLVGKRGDGDLMLNLAAWGRAIGTGEHVGTCRTCGGFCIALRSHEQGKIVWQGGQCLNCKHEFAMPNGEILRRSSRHSEMPQGYWERRTRAQKQAGH